MIFSWLCVMSENSQRNWFEQSLIENPISFSNLIYNSINYFINFSHYTQAVFANQQSKWMSENCFLDKMCIDLSWKKNAIHFFSLQCRPVEIVNDLKMCVRRWNKKRQRAFKWKRLNKICKYAVIYLQNWMQIRFGARDCINQSEMAARLRSSARVSSIYHIFLM